MSDAPRGGDEPRKSTELTVNKKASELSPGGDEKKSPRRDFPFATEDEAYVRLVPGRDPEHPRQAELPDGLQTDGTQPRHVDPRNDTAELEQAVAERKGKDARGPDLPKR